MIVGMRGVVFFVIVLFVFVFLLEGGGVGGCDEIVFVMVGVILFSLFVQVFFFFVFVWWVCFFVDYVEVEEYEFVEWVIFGVVLVVFDDFVVEYGIGQEVCDWVCVEGYQNLEFVNVCIFVCEQVFVDVEVDVFDEMFGQLDFIGIGGGDGGDVDGGVFVLMDDFVDGIVLQMIVILEDVDFVQCLLFIWYEEYMWFKFVFIDCKCEVLFGL